jgi:hypothetical protein
MEVTPVYYHDCPALGPHTRTPRALIADKETNYVIGYRHKCPFCGATPTDLEPASGITLNNDGTYTVDLSKVEKLH